MVLSSSCSSTRKANRGVKKLERLKDKYADVWNEVSKKVVRVDTVIEKIEVPGELQVVVDSNSVDSLVAEINFMIANPQVDTVKGDIVRETITRYIPRFFDVPSLTLDTFDIHLRVFYVKDSMKLEYSIKRDKIEISKEEVVDQINPIEYITIHKVPWWYWVILVGCVLIIGRLIFKNHGN
jgi:hypothetical protein